MTTKPSKLKKGSKDAKRRKSYCARSAGQMKKFPKAAKDPNSRLKQGDVGTANFILIYYV